MLSWLKRVWRRHKFSDYWSKPVRLALLVYAVYACFGAFGWYGALPGVLTAYLYQFFLARWYVSREELHKKAANKQTHYQDIADQMRNHFADRAPKLSKHDIDIVVDVAMEVVKREL